MKHKFVRVVELKQPHPRAFEKVYLVGGALLHPEDIPSKEEVLQLIEMPRIPQAMFGTIDLLIRLSENLTGSPRENLVNSMA
jgi:hypothetical protein